MARNQAELTLVAPGLLGPTAAAAPEFNGFRPRMPAVLEWLGRAGVHNLGPNGPDQRRFALETELGGLFGLTSTDPNELPVAAIARQGESNPPQPGGYWMRADPVHLRTDQDRLILFAGDSLVLSLEEAQRLASEIQALFQDEGWHLEVPDAARWYLRLPGDPGVTTQGLPLAAGRHIDPYLPYGAQAGVWHRWLTEIQMLLYGSSLNLERESRGAVSINSVWFWGGGETPELTTGRWQRVYGDSPLVAGFAALAGIDYRHRPADFTGLAAAEGSALVVLDDLRSANFYGDVADWSARAEALEQAWLAPALAALRTGRYRAITLLPGNAHAYRLTRVGRWRVWRRGDLDRARVRGERAA